MNENSVTDGFRTSYLGMFHIKYSLLKPLILKVTNSTLKAGKMKNPKKLLVEMAALLFSVIVFYLIFHNWDQIREFIGNLF